MGWRNPFRGRMASRRTDSDSDESNVPWVLVIALLVMGLVLVIMVPLMGVMYLDMQNATNKAIIETRKIKELRLQILLER